jgi:hypothetical protein
MAQLGNKTGPVMQGGNLTSTITEPVSEFVHDLGEQVPTALKKSLTFTRYFSLGMVFLLGWGLYSFFKPKQMNLPGI